MRCKDSVFYPITFNKSVFFEDFYKKVPKSFGGSRKSRTFAAHFEKCSAKSGCISAKSKLSALDLH